MNFIKKNYEVLVTGFDSKGHTVGYITGVCFMAVKVANGSLFLTQRQEGKTKIISFNGKNVVVRHFHLQKTKKQKLPISTYN